MHVVVHVAVSLDGATTGFAVDVARFYESARSWSERVTLTGADTILAQEAALVAAPRPGPAVDGPLLAVVDSRWRVSSWDALRNCGYWSDVVALRGGRGGGSDVEEIVTGGPRVDLSVALRELFKRVGDSIVRVDSGGGLNGALLRVGLVDEVSLLVHPCIAGAAAATRWYGRDPLGPTDLKLTSAERLDGGLVWLRYSS